MEYTGPPSILITAIEIFLVLAIIIFALWRGERARSEGDNELVRARTRRAYLCFLLVGGFVSFVATVALISEPYVEVVGIFGAMPVGIVGAIGLFHAFMLWRVRSIQALMLAAILFPGAIQIADFLPKVWGELFVTGYGLGVMVATFRGLRRLGRETAT